MARRTNAAPSEIKAPPTELKPAAVEHTPGFFEQLSQFSSDEWRGMKIYVYRLWPVIDRKETEHFLAKLGQPCDEDYLLGTFGTGKYYLRLNNSRGNAIASHTVSVYNAEYPPRVNPEEVVASDPQNERYFKTWAKPQTPAPDSSGAVADIARVALEGNKRPVLDPQILSLWEKTNAERDNLAQRLVELSQKQPAPVATEPMAMFREMLATMREIQKPPAETPQRSATDSIKEMAELLTIVRENFSPVPPPVSGDGGTFWPMLAQIAAPALTHITQMIGTRMMQPSAPATATAQPAGAPQPSPVAAQVAPASSGQPTTNPSDPTVSYSYMDMLRELGRDALDAMERGIDGDDFAQAVCCRNRVGEQLYEALYAMGKAQILSMLAMSPGLSEQLTAKRAQVETWLDDFIKYGDPEQEEEPSKPEKAA